MEKKEKSSNWIFVKTMRIFADLFFFKDLSFFLSLNNKQQIKQKMYNCKKKIYFFFKKYQFYRKKNLISSFFSNFSEKKINGHKKLRKIVINQWTFEYGTLFQPLCLKISFKSLINNFQFSIDFGVKIQLNQSVIVSSKMNFQFF